MFNTKEKRFLVGKSQTLQGACSVLVYLRIFSLTPHSFCDHTRENKFPRSLSLSVAFPKNKSFRDRLSRYASIYKLAYFPTITAIESYSSKIQSDKYTQLCNGCMNYTIILKESLVYIKNFWKIALLKYLRWIFHYITLWIANICRNLTYKYYSRLSSSPFYFNTLAAFRLDYGLKTCR